MTLFFSNRVLSIALSDDSARGIHVSRRQRRDFPGRRRQAWHKHWRPSRWTATCVERRWRANRVTSRSAAFRSDSELRQFRRSRTRGAFWDLGPPIRVDAKHHPAALVLRCLWSSSTPGSSIRAPGRVFRHAAELERHFRDERPPASCCVKRRQRYCSRDRPSLLRGGPVQRRSTRVRTGFSRWW